MVKIRLKRMGMKKKPFYRVVVADERASRDGRFIDELGYYNPVSNPVELKIDAEKAQQWIKNGAQPTDTVRAQEERRHRLIATQSGEARKGRPDNGRIGSLHRLDAGGSPGAGSGENRGQPRIRHHRAERRPG